MASIGRVVSRSFQFSTYPQGLSGLGAWVRLHYVYPYPHVRDLIPMMADRSNGLLPYLDIPFQHAHPDTLRRMARPAAAERTLDEIRAWRSDCPDITLRSTFIVGYPGETEAEFQTLLDWMDEAQLDRVGCFKYENVDGARSNALPDHVAEEVKEERWHRFMEKAQAISEAKLRPRSVSGCRSSSMPWTMRPPPAAPGQTRRRSTATFSSTRGSSGSRPATW
jgi:ribosomal protein S12 methylthiotransferase